MATGIEGEPINPTTASRDQLHSQRPPLLQSRQPPQSANTFQEEARTSQDLLAKSKRRELRSVHRRKLYNATRSAPLPPRTLSSGALSLRPASVGDSSHFKKAGPIQNVRQAISSGLSPAQDNLAIPQSQTNAASSHVSRLNSNLLKAPELKPIQSDAVRSTEVEGNIASTALPTRLGAPTDLAKRPTSRQQAGNRPLRDSSADQRLPHHVEAHIGHLSAPPPSNTPSNESVATTEPAGPPQGTENFPRGTRAAIGAENNRSTTTESIARSAEAARLTTSTLSETSVRGEQSPLLTRSRNLSSGASSSSMAATANATTIISSEPQFRTVRLGIESEFYLEAKRPEAASHQIEGFVDKLAINHNREVRSEHPRMFPSLQQYRPPKGYDYTTWAMALDKSNENEKSPCKSPPPKSTLNHF
jgi:hypothetical protein